jgi:hypothetical protein
MTTQDKLALHEAIVATLNQARCLEGRTVGNIELTQRIMAVIAAHEAQAQAAPQPEVVQADSREYQHAMGGWLGAVSELIEAMGRPAFKADTPVHVIAEAIREAAKRLAAQQAEREGLTDEQIVAVAKTSQDGISPHCDTLRFGRAIERAHGIGKDQS